MKNKKQNQNRKQPWHRKPAFGSLYTMPGSKYIYISIYYFKLRRRFPSDREDSPKNWEELYEFMDNIGMKIKNRTFVFAKAFYWLDAETKAYFTNLEGGNYKPEPEHVLFREYAVAWMERKIPCFDSISKQRYYSGAIISRILPFFEKMSFANITPETIETFINNLKRCNGSSKIPLSVQRIKNIIGPLSKIWVAACSDNNWNLHNPFSCVSEKYREIKDRELQEKERQVLMTGDYDEDIISTRDVLLLSEWQRILKAVDPHYHLVMELLLMGMIGSELEGLQKRHIKDNTIQVRCTLVRDKGGKIYLKFKPKNWYRKREIPLTRRLKNLTDLAAASSTSDSIIKFENGIELPAHSFLLTMKDGRPFNYDSFHKTIWEKAFKITGLERRVPYSSRHSFVQWSLLIGVSKSRLVDLMGHSTKKMIDEVYGKYRKGLIDEREKILDYMGEDFLALEELKTYFPERYQKAMAMTAKLPKTAKIPTVTATFGQSFGQSQGFYADNYLESQAF